MLQQHCCSFNIDSDATFFFLFGSCLFECIHKGNVKCCDVPTKKATKVSTSNHGGGGEGVGGWSCAVNDDNFLRVDTYVETAYHTTTCNGVECATNKM